MKQLKIIFATFMLLCLFRMPYGYYSLVRFIATVGFIYLAYQYFKLKKKDLYGLLEPWLFFSSH